MAQAQIQIELPADVNTAIRQQLEGSGVTIRNVQIMRWSAVSQVAIFRNGTENTGTKPNIGIESGLVLSTGDTTSLTWPTKDPYGWSIGGSTTEEYDLLALLNKTSGYIDDPVVITFDLIPTTNNITIDFAFGSDEYEQFVGSDTHIDAYGFFISGPGIHGPFTNNAVNIAEFPSGDPVSTNYVNRDRNSDYYIRNPDVTFYHNWYSSYERGNHVALNGWTKVVTNYLPVQVGKTYRVKIALGDGGDGTYDSSVFIGKFKSERQLAGRVFHHRAEPVDEEALAEGDKRYQYFANARVVLFDHRGMQIQETRTGPRGEYRFTVDKNRGYQIAVDASSLTPDEYYPEQTWSSLGGLCSNGIDGTRLLDHSGYCYGGKNGNVQDKLKNNNRSKFAEHLIIVDAGQNSDPNLNFGFSFDAITHTNDSGQGSLRHFIVNANRGVGTGQMLFIPAVPANAGKGWKITIAKNGILPSLTRIGATVDGRARDLFNPTQPVYPGLNTIAQTLELTTKHTLSPLLTLNGSNQSLIYTALTDNNRLRKPLVKLLYSCRNCTVSNNLIANNRGPGVVVTNSSAGNRISKNHYYRNIVNGITIPIDLGEDGINANNGDNGPLFNQRLDRPIIETTSLDEASNQLIITGFAPKGSTVEFYQLSQQGYQFFFAATEGRSDDLANNKGSYQDPVSGQTLTQQRFHFAIPLPATGTTEVAALAIDRQGNTSEFSPPVTLFLRSTINGIVWHDLNENGKQDSNEPGITGVKLQLTEAEDDRRLPTGSSSQTTDKNGKATFYGVRSGEYSLAVLPGQSALANLVPGQHMVNPVSLKVGYGMTTEAFFGYVRGQITSSTSLSPAHRKSTAPGLFVHFPHTLTSDSGGTVTLSALWLGANGQLTSAGQQSTGWPVKLAQFDCDSQDNQGTPITGPLTLIAKEPVCFRASFFVPDGTPQGISGNLAIIANSTDNNVNGRTEEQTPAGKELARVIDQIFVSDQDSGRLKLQKSVENKTLEESAGSANTAGSGDTLIYTIEFENIGAGPLNNLKIMDNTPAFAELLKPAACPETHDIPAGLGECELHTLGPDNNDKGFRGRIIWEFSGTLAPGAKGQLSYELMVE